MFHYPAPVTPVIPAVHTGTTVVIGDVEFAVLELLGHDALTGLELLTSIEYLQRQLGPQFRFKRGDLFPILCAMVDAGLILKRVCRLPGGIERAKYHLTHQGKLALESA
ncbi:PadR family transcriptional regulator [Deinococcus peraridilitoris]|uniref:Putative transcriptional regulator n=1 Tax=Deinococcus peraridilitoris (strain DSM 19664 / LMG 22246 / CIP 109416 / KR-200) TaxID=937777 RepID=K9ZWX8_DEIPD|nr:PadR family transcriptional regulator [Deinococcus peraridilitoris]AFZ65684.1 putative transcriptional regulator [Deinococcus peraridilitoris DSM 19664]